MNLLNAGNRNAFRELFDRHSSSVFGYCLSFTGGNRALAEDILQDVWMKMLRAASRYEGKGQFRSWLLTIARNTALRALSRQLQLHKEPAEAEAQLVAKEDIELDLSDRTDNVRMQKAIEELPDAQRAVLLLWLTEEPSYDEMAATLGLSEPSVRSLLFRAKKSLKKALETE